MQKANKLIFWIIILVFVFSSVLAYSSMSFGTQNIGQDNRVVVSPEEKQVIEDEALADVLGQGMEGILRKEVKGISPEENVFKIEGLPEKTETYYLEVEDIVMTILEESNNINFDKYLNKNVKVWGDISQNQTDDQLTMVVSKIEAR